MAAVCRALLGRGFQRGLGQTKLIEGDPRKTVHIATTWDPFDEGVRHVPKQNSAFKVSLSRLANHLLPWTISAVKILGLDLDITANLALIVGEL